MAEILIVEDDENIAKMISITLSMEGHSFDVCYDGITAEKMIGQKAYDVILLDIMLPGQSGFELLSKIRPENGAVIFLTALQDVSDKVKGLKLGAEDYIVKPFEPIELLARIEVVLRRQNKAGTFFCYGDIEADESKHTVLKGGQPVTLTPKEFELLIFFMRHKGIALTREKILYGVWGYQFMGETRTVDAHVQQIRKKLSLQNSIVTIPKVGYRLETGDLK